MAALFLLTFSPSHLARADDEQLPRTALTREELGRREALTLYARGLLFQNSHRLLDALHALERARQLDPDSAAINLALAPLYQALDRDEDALQAYRQAVDLSPEDGDAVFSHARLLKRLERNGEARSAFEKALAGPAFRSRPELRLQALLDLTSLYETAKDLRRAVQMLQQAADLLEKPEPLLGIGAYDREELLTQTADVYEHLGRARVAAKDWPGALAAFQKVQQTDPSRHLRLAYNLSEIYLAQHEAAKALSAIEFYLRSQPTGMEGYERLVEVLRKVGREQEVPAFLERYVASDPGNLSLKVLLARVLLDGNQVTRADALLGQLIRTSASVEVYKVWYLLARRQGTRGAELVLQHLDEILGRAADKDEHTRGDPDAAAHARAMLAALRDDPDLVRALLIAARARLSNQGLEYATRNALAEVAARTRHLDEAEELYRDCLRDRVPPRPGGEQEIYSGLLRVLVQGRKYPAIVAVCRQGLKDSKETNPVLFYTNLALALAVLGKKEEAVREANAGVNFASDTERFECHRTRALVLAEIGRYDRAVAECQAMLQKFTEPEQVRSIRLLFASVHTFGKNFAQADEQLQLILATDPDEPTANNDLGFSWAERGKNLEQAEKLIRKSIALDSDRDNAAFVDSLGWVLLRQGKLTEARQELERAASLPDGLENPSLWDHLGDVCDRQGDQARAREAWKKAVELYEKGLRPFDDHSRDVRQKLRRSGQNQEQP